MRDLESVSFLAMNQAEANRILEMHLERARNRTYEELRGLIGNPETDDVKGSDGTSYQVETDALWDDRAQGNLRVLISVDDGGLRAFAPVTADFILSSAGAFVGE